MKQINALLAKPVVRLALRALLAAITVVISKYLAGGTTVHALVVGGVLAFAEVFTPLNPLVGYFKSLDKPPV